MAGRGRPGAAPQTDKREAFARLIAAGVSNLQACRMVGINPRTGKRWRHGRTITSSSGRRLQYPPVIGSPVREISPRFLAEDERGAIAELSAGPSRAAPGPPAPNGCLNRGPSPDRPRRTHRVTAVPNAGPGTATGTVTMSAWSRCDVPPRNRPGPVRRSSSSPGWPATWPQTRCGRSPKPSRPATPPTRRRCWTTTWCPSRPTRPWRPSPGAPG